MQIHTTKKCENCSMIAHFTETVNDIKHHYCEHHKTVNALPISDIQVQTDFQKLIPLLLIFGVIIVLTIGTMILKNDLSPMSAMMFSMAYFFLVFGGFKVANLHNFVDAYMTYDVVAMKSKVYAYLYPFVEIILGIAYFFYIGGIYRDLFTFILMSIGTYGVWKALQHKNEIPCACLGMVFTVPMTKVTLFENLFMATMALVMVLMYLVMGSMAM